MIMSGYSNSFFHKPQSHHLASRHVAVIGAGAAGLVAARELRREGHKVIVFERGDQLGGTWVYNPNVESDPIGVHPNRTLVHSSMYESLRTNLPREAMGFRDYPFVAKKGDEERDPRRFPVHREVLMYLKDFAGEFGISEIVRLETEVVLVDAAAGGKWKVKSRSKGGGDVEDEIYDAVVVCSGHHTEPRLPQIQGINTWKGKQIHSHNYRTPAPFQNQIKGVHEDGSLVFRDGSFVVADIILYCTGYKYHFPFLKTNDIVTVDDNCVGPLYKHIFPPALAPSLSFVGLPWMIAPFPMFEFQSKWIAGILSNRIALPSQEEMMEDVKAFHSSLETLGIRKHYTHNVFGYKFGYDEWLAAQCGCPGFEEWRKQMYIAALENLPKQPETYRDELEDHHLVLQAHQDFTNYTVNGVGVVDK
ncbi:flavin-containing monooxygenase FMO GS-OX-like 4 isoform X2 [Pyrus communis]|uniref:flavin-containing monooxygenase FMO GS-OX-like 4 isoform X2 n=1 Tax=Pyrus communis TaxID=23211 RepID=UPI0035C1FFB4